MKNVVKVNTMVKFTNDENAGIRLETENHVYGTVPLFQQFSPDDIQTLDTGDMDRTEVPAAQNFLDKVVEHGFIDGNRKFVPVFAGSSPQRNGQGAFCEESKFAAIVDWCSCGGITPTKASPLAIGKIAKYLALMMSTCKRWADVFGDKEYMPYPELKDWAVINDVEAPLVEIVDKTSPTDVERECVFAFDGEPMKITDGFSFYVIDDTLMTRKERAAVIRDMEACTFRLAMHKGLLKPVLKSTLLHFYEVHPEASHIVKDAWGNEQNLLEKTVITFKSVFKGWKMFKSHEHFVQEAETRGHEVWVCVTAHGKTWKSLPYQQLQTLNMTHAQIEYLAHVSCDFMLQHMKPGEIGKIVGGWIGKCLDAHPGMIHDPAVREAVVGAYLSKCKSAFGGRVLHVSHNLLCSPDPLAVLEGIHGLPVVGAIPRGSVITGAFNEGKKLGCTRSPHLDHAWFIARNMEPPAEWAGLYGGTTIFYACHDSVMVLHQMDFDGDKSNVTDNEAIISIAEASRELYNSVPLLYAAMDAGSKAGCENYVEELKVLFRNLSKAPIGLYANTLTKIWAIMPSIIASGDQRKLRRTWLQINCCTRKANTCIDEAGGHGKDASIGVAEEALDDYGEVGKPWFLRYAKGTIENGRIVLAGLPTQFEFYSNSVVDQYSATCRAMLPENIDELLNYDEFGEFVPVLLQSAPIKGRNLRTRLKGLIEDNKENMFFNLVSSAYTEEQLIETSSSLKAVPDFKLDKAQEIEIEVAEFAMERGCTLDDAIDYITFVLFHKIRNTNAPFLMMMKRWFFIVFGERVLANIIKNRELDPEQFAAEYAEDEDDDEEEA